MKLDKILLEFKAMFVEAGGDLPQEKKYISVWRRYLNDFVISIEHLGYYIKKRFSEGKGVFFWRWYAHQPDLGANVHRVMPTGVLYPERTRVTKEDDLRLAKRAASPPQSLRLASSPA